MERVAAVRGGGFTLVELMVALVIALALAAVAAPFGVSLMRERAWEEGQRQVKAGVEIAAAEARRAGSAIALWHEADGGEQALVLRRFGPGEGTIGEPLFELPAGIELVFAENELSEEDAGTREGPARPETATGGAAPGRGRMVVVASSTGRIASVTEGLEIRDGRGRRVAVRVAEWTGEVTFEDVGGERRVASDRPGESR